MSAFDVAIAGGGPGGCATALSLSAHAPSLSVIVIEASAYEEVRIGETLPPVARPILEHLGVWEAFKAQAHRQVHGTTAAWGRATLSDNDFLYMARGPGWHLDRARFDGMLAAECERRGVRVLRSTRVVDLSASDGWRLALDAGERIAARFIVDATGGSARFARRCGARVESSDRLLGFARFFRQENGAPRDPRTIVEAFENGWWYTAGLPNAQRIAVCMTDADLGRENHLADADCWTRGMMSMPVTRAMIGDAAAIGGVVVRSAESRVLDPPAGDDWLAVGDAASTFDPLSSQGIVKALRGGVFASYAIGDALVQATTVGLERYRTFIGEEFASYLEARRRYYAEERRWPSSPFWRRRHAER